MVIPPALQSKVLALLHDGYLGADIEGLVTAMVKDPS